MELSNRSLHSQLGLYQLYIHILKDDVKGGNTRCLLVGEAKRIYEPPVVVSSPISNGRIASAATHDGNTALVLLIVDDVYLLLCESLVFLLESPSMIYIS